MPSDPARWPGSSSKRERPPLPPFDPGGLPEAEGEGEEETGEEIARWPGSPSKRGPPVREAESWMMVLLPEEGLAMNRAVMPDWSGDPAARKIVVVEAHLPGVPAGRLRDMVKLALETGDLVSWTPGERVLRREHVARPREKTWGESVVEEGR
ncbi:MAG: hypothetical protein QME96_16835 [Myxococcota bacterium]|nr:hypothetical protein [Myxococcota bacterium]